MTGALRAKPLSGMLIASDIDGTIVDGDTLFDFFGAFGLKSEAQRLDALEPGSDVQILLDRIASSGPIAQSAFRQIGDKAQFFPGALDFFARLQSLGARVLLLSATYEPIARKIAERLGLDDAIVCATRVETQGDQVFGFSGPLMERMEKRRRLERVCVELDVAFSEVVGLADSSGDRDFMNSIEQGGGTVFWVKKPDFAAIEKSILERRNRGGIEHA